MKEILKLLNVSVDAVGRDIKELAKAEKADENAGRPSTFLVHDQTILVEK